MTPAAIIFDLDGTLVDSRADLATAINLTRRDFELPPLPVPAVAAMVGEGLRKLVERALPEIAAARQAEAVERARAHYGEHLLDETRLYPDVIPVLNRLAARGWALAIVTNKPQEFTESILLGLAIQPFFRVIIGGGVCPKLKPDPEPLLLALERIGASADGSWIVGDHFTDMEAGRRAGLSRCFCRYGFGDLRDEAFDLAIERLSEFTEHLEQHRIMHGGI